MKRIISLLLVAILMAVSVPTVAETAVDTGLWEKCAYLDAFDRPTNKYYISNKEPLIGKFRNATVSDALLNAWIQIEGGEHIAFKLAENGTDIVRNTSDEPIKYDISIMTANLPINLYGYMESGEDTIRLSTKKLGALGIDSDNQRALDYLCFCKNEVFDFSITKNNDQSTRYIFSADMTGFYDLLPFTQIGEYSEGLAYAMKGGLYGYIDMDGKLAIPCEYEKAWDFNNGSAVVKKNGKYGGIDNAGNVITPFEYVDYNELFAWNNNGFLKVKGENGLGGYLDASGKLIAPCEYVEVNDFKEGLAVVMKNGKKWGVINTSGEEIVPCGSYDEIEDFFNGFARVKKEARWGCIDTVGNLVVPCEYKALSDFNEQGLAEAKKDDKWGIIDTSGNVVLPFEYEEILRISSDSAKVRNSSGLTKQVDFK